MDFEQSCALAPRDLNVERTDDKGRILVAEEQLDRGDDILLEYSLLEVVGDGPLFDGMLQLLDGDKDFAIMYWGAFHSLCAEDWNERTECKCCDEPLIAKQLQKTVLVLHQHESSRERTCTVVRYLNIPDRSADLFHSLFQVWCGNSFDCSDERNHHSGVLYFLPAMLSHSCRPNCVWHFGAHNVFILRARNDIEPGDELTIPYLSPEELRLPTAERRQILKDTKGFVCACERCEGVDTLRTFLCTSCSKPQATISDGTLCCPCGWTTSEEEAIKREEKARTAPEMAVEILGKRHWIAAQTWQDETVSHLCRRLSFLNYHGLGATGEAPKILEALGDIQANHKSTVFNLAEAAKCYKQASDLYLDLFGSDHENHLIAHRKFLRAAAQPRKKDRSA